MNPTNTSQILDQVDRFYSSAFGQLIILVVSIITAVGVVVPLLIALFQKSTITDAVRNLHEQVNQQFLSVNSTIKKTVAEEVARLMAIEILQIEQKLEKLSKHHAEELKKQEEVFAAKMAAVEAKVWHAHANSAWGDSNYCGSVFAGCHAAQCYITCKEEGNLVIILGIIKTNLGKVTKAAIAASTYPTVDFMDKLIERLRNFNPNGRYDEHVRELKSEFEKAKGR